MNYQKTRDARNKLDFNIKNRIMIEDMGKDASLKHKSCKWIEETARYEYGYHFKWLGIPVIQLPQDMVAMQEIIWEVKPDLIIETGIAHGGSLIMYASFIELLGKGHVLGIDIDIRTHNRYAIEEHPMFKRITMFEGSSVSDEIAEKVRDFAKEYKKVMVILDSNHTHEHVLKELNLYSPLVSKGSYCVVFDTIVEDLPDELFNDRTWGKGNNPKTAVHEFLKTHEEFESDETIPNKLSITAAPDGYLRRK